VSTGRQITKAATVTKPLRASADKLIRFGSTPVVRGDGI